MAEPISLASGLLTLATFAFKSSATLCKTVQSFKSHPRQVRDLTEEVEALNEVLRALTETVAGATDVDLSALNLPLLRCGNACKEFEQEIMKCSSRSGGNRTSFRDWAKLRYMGDDIDGFKRLLGGYKSTIVIALTDANLRKSSVTAESLESYRNLIVTATDDLETHLRDIDEKLETMLSHAVPGSNSDATELRRIKEERISAQRCLQICARLSDHISQIQITPERSSRSPGAIDSSTVPEMLVIDGLRECKNSLNLTSARIEKHMKDRIDQLVAKSKAAATSEEDLADILRLRDEWDTARQCMDICSKADTHLKENITNIDNYATGDAVQFMVSTDGKIVHGRNRGLGWRTRQFGGHLSDTSLQSISRDFSSISFQRIESESSSSPGNTPSAPDNGMEHNTDPQYRERYGRGYKLSPKATADMSMPSAGSAEGTASGSPKG